MQYYVIYSPDQGFWDNFRWGADFARAEIFTEKEIALPDGGQWLIFGVRKKLTISNSSGTVNICIN